MRPNWVPRLSDFNHPSQLDSGSKSQLVSEPKIPLFVKKILALRGYTESEHIEKLLYPKISELKDPLAINQMSKAIDRLWKAFLDKERICVYADFDLDGTSGLALMLTGLRQLGFTEVLGYQPKRLSEGYGFHANVVEELKAQGVSVIITVDVGITSLEACKKAKSLGIDVLLTDHHLPGEVLPDVYALMNPNVPGDNSGLGYLCGAGVAFYFLRALKRKVYDELGSEAAQKFDLKNILEFFTIATLTDMVPLIEDNRVLVKHGLMQIEKTQKSGLRALLEKLDLADRPLTSSDVAIRFAPKLNALSRMESGVLPIDLFLCEDPIKAKELVKSVMSNNNTRVQLQSEAETEAIELVNTQESRDFIFVASPNFHRGVIGLIATKLSQLYNKPSFVGSVDPQEGTIVGSARRPSGLEISLVEAMGHREKILNRFGGHSAAAGFELLVSKQSEFIEMLSDFYKKQLEAPRAPTLHYDLDLELEEVDEDLMKWYDFVGPFGTGFETPLFHMKDLTVLESKDLKGGHLKLKLANSRKKTTEALLFSPTDRQSEELNKKHESYHLLTELQWNYFAGRKRIQMLIRDIKGSAV